jgi:hypothetical protein
LLVDVEIPINATVLAITLFKPLVTFGEVMAVELYIVSAIAIVSESTLLTYEASRRAERTRMHALENEMFVRWDALGPVLCWCAPG